MLQRYPQSALIRLDAFSVIGAWVAFAISACLWFIGLTSFSLPSYVLASAFGAFFVLAVLHLVLSFSHSCPRCRKHPTIQGILPIHKNAQPEVGVDGWAHVVWSVWRHKRFVCIHCGTGFMVGSEAQ